MNEEKIVGFCPKCGKKLEIPEDLEEFSCMYCGARMKKDALLPEKTEPAPEAVGDRDACFRFGVQGLVNAIMRYPDAMRNLTRDAFAPFFEKYEGENREAVRQLDLAAQGGDYGEAADRAAERFLSELGQELADNHKALASRDAEVEDAKFTLCLFLIPMIRKQRLPISEPLAEAIYVQWQKVYPKHLFSLTTYEEITEGFQRRKLCFITTAVCESKGKPDDCQELTAFRVFRDGYLLSCPDGEKLIREYYDVAPGIVLAIRAAGERGEFDRIWTEYLAPCYAEIRRGENEKCKKTYTQMVQALEKKYLKM